MLSYIVLHSSAHIESSLEGVYLENFLATVLSDLSMIIYYMSFFSHVIAEGWSSEQHTYFNVY